MGRSEGDLGGILIAFENRLIFYVFAINFGHPSSKSTDLGEIYSLGPIGPIRALGP